MPPRKSGSTSGSTAASSRKTTSSISSAFRATGSKSASSPFSAPGSKPGSRSSSLTKPSLKDSAVAPRSTSVTAERSASPEKKEERTLSKKEEDEARDLPDLDVDDRSYNGIWKVVQQEKLGKVGAIHAAGQNKIHHILRTFDLDPAYGPCLGLTRLERWTRAKELGEEPPVEVYEILNTKEGRLKAEYRENCLAGTGI